MGPFIKLGSSYISLAHLDAVEMLAPEGGDPRARVRFAGPVHKVTLDAEDSRKLREILEQLSRDRDLLGR